MSDSNAMDSGASHTDVDQGDSPSQPTAQDVSQNDAAPEPESKTPQADEAASKGTGASFDDAITLNIPTPEVADGGETKSEEAAEPAAAPEAEPAVMAEAVADVAAEAAPEAEPAATPEANSEATAEAAAGVQSDGTVQPESENSSEATPNAAKKKFGNKKLLKKVGIIVAAVIVVIIAVVVLWPGQAMDLDNTAQDNGISVGYPSAWTASDPAEAKLGDFTTQYLTISENTSVGDSAYGQGVVMVYAVDTTQMKTPPTQDAIQSALGKEGVTVTEDFSDVEMSGCKASEGEVTYTDLYGKVYKGPAVVMITDRDCYVCLALTASGANKNIAPTMDSIIENLEIADHYIATFTSDGATVGSASCYDYGSGGSVKSPAGLTAAGYAIDGWKAESGDSSSGVKVGTEINGICTISNIKSDVTLSAIWVPAWTVTFTDGMGGVLSAASVKNGGAATAPSNPTRSGYTFEGWDGSYSNVTSDLTINATWKIIPTTSMNNALKKAKSYLNYSAFSYSGLIEQLEFEGFSADDATYGADNCGADWNAQAAKKAESYMKYMSFSRSGLIDQLEFEGFTSEQAAYGADSVGL